MILNPLKGNTHADRARNNAGDKGEKEAALAVAFEVRTLNLILSREFIAVTNEEIAERLGRGNNDD